jgi:hypothetical protein
MIEPSDKCSRRGWYFAKMAEAAKSSGSERFAWEGPFAPAEPDGPCVSVTRPDGNIGIEVDHCLGQPEKSKWV